MATHPTNASPPTPDDEIRVLTDLLWRVENSADTVPLSRSDKVRICYGLRLLRLEMARQVHETFIDTATEQADERGQGARYNAVNQ